MTTNHQYLQMWTECLKPYFAQTTKRLSFTFLRGILITNKSSKGAECIMLNFFLFQKWLMLWIESQSWIQSSNTILMKYGTNLVEHNKQAEAKEWPYLCPCTHVDELLVANLSTLKFSFLFLASEPEFLVPRLRLRLRLLDLPLDLPRDRLQELCRGWSDLSVRVVQLFWQSINTHICSAFLIWNPTTKQAFMRMQFSTKPKTIDGMHFMKQNVE